MRGVLGLVTCSVLPVVDPDQARIDAALARGGVAGEWVVWDDPAVDWSRFEAAWIHSTWDYTARYPEFLEWVERASAATALWNPAAVVRWNSHKGYLLDLGAAGVPIVPTRLVRADEAFDLGAALAEAAWPEAVVKPAVSVGAIGAGRVRLADGGSDVVGEAALADARAFGDVLVQPFVPEIAHGETSIVMIGGAPVHAARKVPAAGDFRIHEQYGGRVEAVEATPAELEVAALALAAVDHEVPVGRVDLVSPAGGDPLVMELELIEPYLFLELAPRSVHDLLARALAGLLT